MLKSIVQFILYCAAATWLVSFAGCQFKENAGEKGFVPSENSAQEWSEALSSEGRLEADLDGDGKKDLISMDYVELEGSRYIEKFEVTMADKERTFCMDQVYNADFVKMEFFDVDKDQKKEMLLLFDTHGGGGEGTHDLYLLWLYSDEITAQKADPYVEGIEDIDASWNIDGIFDIEKVLDGEEEKLLACQYVWGPGGHSDKVGYLVSAVSFQKDKNTFVADESRLETERSIER